MKIVKRVFIILGILAILVVGTAALVPIIFKDELVAIVKDAANDHLNAKLDFGEVQLSLLRSFPDLSFKLEDISITGIEEFEGLPLARIQTFELELDLLSVIQSSKPVVVKSINIDKPEIQILVLNNGKANYDIAKTTDTSPSPDTSAEEAVYKFKLNKYNIRQGKLIYEDHAAKLKLLIDQLQHSGSGAFDNNIFDLQALTSIQSLSLIYDQMTYLRDAQIDWATTLGINQKDQLYAIKDNKLSVNALLLQLDGSVQMIQEALKINMNLSAPENEFKNLISLIPNAYTQNFDQVESSGDFALEAYASGVYKFDNSEYPPFNARLDINNGYVKYPDLPLPIENIRAEVALASPSSNFDDILIEAPRLGWTIDENPFLASLTLRKPISDPDFESTLKGKLDLEDLKRALPGYLDQDMAGLLDFDMALSARMSTIEKEQYDELALSGQLDAANIRYPLDAYGYPALSLTKANVTFTPQQATINQLVAQAGDSDLRGNGQINNLLAYFSPEKTMTGNFVLSSNFIDADQWYPPAPPKNESLAIDFQDTTKVNTTERPFDRFDFNVALDAEKIQYTSYLLENTEAEARVRPNLIRIKNAVSKIKDSDFRASGRIDRLFDYLYDDGTLGGQLNLQSDLINLNSLYAPEGSATPTTSSNTTYEAPLIPANIEMIIQTNIKELRYGEITFKEMAGQLDITDQAAILQDMSARALGGDILLSGQYATKDSDQPYFSIKYDLKKLDFVESFKKASIFKKLNPIAEFVEGKYSTSLILDGRLGNNLYPDFSTLNAQGFFETIDGLVKGLQPLQKIGSLLKINELQQAVRIQDTRNYFEVKNGFVEVKPFDLRIDEIDMKIAGRHSLDQNMDYVINARAPRAMLEKSNIGALAGEGLAALEKQAQKLGIKVDQAPFINLGITVKGSLKNPDIGVKVLGLSNEDGAIVAQTDSSSVRLGEVLSEKAEQGKEEAGKVIDSAKVAVKEKAEATKDSLSQKLKEQAEEKAREILGKGDSTTVDSIKQALEKWNPFKKKKKNNN